MMHHEKLVSAYMTEHGSITQMEAYEQLGCMRLASVICRMRKRGEAIKAETVEGKNRFGHPVRYTRYSYV